MAQNSTLKVLAGVAVVTLLVVSTWSHKSAVDANPKKKEANNLGRQSGDTINESLHVVSARSQKLSGKVDKVSEELAAEKKKNQQIMQEITTLKERRANNTENGLVKELSHSHQLPKAMTNKQPTQDSQSKRLKTNRI